MRGIHRVLMFDYKLKSQVILPYPDLELPLNPDSLSHPMAGLANLPNPVTDTDIKEGRRESWQDD